MSTAITVTNKHPTLTTHLTTALALLSTANNASIIRSDTLFQAVTNAQELIQQASHAANNNEFQEAEQRLLEASNQMLLATKTMLRNTSSRNSKQVLGETSAKALSSFYDTLDRAQSELSTLSNAAFNNRANSILKSFAVTVLLGAGIGGAVGGLTAPAFVFGAVAGIAAWGVGALLYTLGQAIFGKSSAKTDSFNVSINSADTAAQLKQTAEHAAKAEATVGVTAAQTAASNTATSNLTGEAGAAQPKEEGTKAPTKEGAAPTMAQLPKATTPRLNN